MTNNTRVHRWVKIRNLGWFVGVRSGVTGYMILNTESVRHVRDLDIEELGVYIEAPDQVKK